MPIFHKGFFNIQHHHPLSLPVEFCNAGHAASSKLRFEFANVKTHCVSISPFVACFTGTTRFLIPVQNRLAHDHQPQAGIDIRS